MEPTQQNQQQNEDTNSGSYGGGGAKGSFLCRQSSARWTPTTEQIRILKDLYYNNGVRSPSADQIQRISARLRQYGKIEGKNVFYWFQNHKARERQKKRFISDHLVSPLPSPTTQQQQQQQQLRRDSTVASSTTPPAASNRKPEQDYKNKKFPCKITAATSITPAASSSSAGVLGVGNYGYGSMTMEKCFRDCSISPKAKRATGGSKSHNYGWIGGNIYDPYKPSCNFYGHETTPTLYEDLEEEEEEEEEEAAAEEAACSVETLPLFPMHHEDFDGGYSNSINCNNSSAATNYYFSNGGGSYTSLELSLNSFFGHSPDSL